MTQIPYTDLIRQIEAEAKAESQSAPAPGVPYMPRCKGNCGDAECRQAAEEYRASPSAQPEQPTDEQRARELWNHLNDKSRVSGIEDLINFAARERRETAQRVCNNVRKHFYPRADHRYAGVQITEWLDEAGKAEGV